jgi:membrane-associated protease RseP (regulator of RpoE activity)
VPPRFVAVVPGSLAFHAGLRAGDELAQLDDADVRDWGGDRLAPLLAMRPLNLRVIRQAQLADGQMEPQSPGNLASLDDIQLELGNSPV